MEFLKEIFGGIAVIVVYGVYLVLLIGAMLSGAWLLYIILLIIFFLYNKLTDNR